ncbi:APC family permease [Microbacterium sp. BWT-B31]|uniref:APC family permease n=1 Tax=Microbacterium sp. BWT-B31 TaxID=3232072 RepID=UPI003528CA82
MSHTESNGNRAVATTDKLASRRLGVWGIVFFVVSAAAPLTVVASAAPTAFRVGGIGAPGAILASGAVLILFAVGFTAMSRYVRNTGAFYAYGARGLGKPAGLGIALVTILSYGFLCVCFYGFIGFFAQMTFGSLLNIDLPWGVYSAITLVLVAVLGYRQIDVGAKLLGVLLTAEVLILLVLAVAVLAQGGPEPASAAPFAPDNVFFAAGSGALFVFGFGSYLGFEGTAIYTEEAKNPQRTIPAATYLAVSFLAIFYAFTFWVLTMAFGVDGVLQLAAGDAFQDMAFEAAGARLGLWATIAMQVLIVTSFLACLLAFHNACSRYLFAMGRERLLPPSLSRTHPVTNAPYRASMVMSVVALVAVTVCIAFSLDPFLGFAVPTYSIGVAGLVFAQAVAAFSVVGFFARDRRGHSVWRVIVAPTLGALGLTTGFVLIATNFELVTGVEGWVNAFLLAPTPLLFIAGVVWALILRRRRPQHYAELATFVADASEE